MIATMEYVTILDYAENLGQMIIKSDVMHDYQAKKQELSQNKEAQALIRAFTNIKDHYDDVERFGRYHPDYHKIMKEVRVTKKRDGYARCGCCF